MGACVGAGGQGPHQRVCASKKKKKEIKPNRIFILTNNNIPLMGWPFCCSLWIPPKTVNCKSSVVVLFGRCVCVCIRTRNHLPLSKFYSCLFFRFTLSLFVRKSDTSQWIVSPFMTVTCLNTGPSGRL